MEEEEGKNGYKSAAWAMQEKGNNLAQSCHTDPPTDGAAAAAATHADEC